MSRSDPAHIGPEILFIDIETAGTQASFDDLSPDMQLHWRRKCDMLYRKELAGIQIEESYSEIYLKKAAIYAEFGKVICVSMGYFHPSADGCDLRIKSLIGEEKEILLNLSALLNSHFNARKEHSLCGHNIKEFDIPYLARRMIILGIELPKPLLLSGLKPWQVGHLIDTLNLWKFGDYKHYISLDLLCHLLDIPSPKSTMSGEDVHSFYWEGRMEEIRSYCEADVITTAQVYCKLCQIKWPNEFRLVAR